MPSAYADLNPSPRLLLGPGPSAVHPRVLRAMSTPLLGYTDPEFWKLMDETQELLRHAFQTANALTLPVSGTGMAGMEAVLSNLLEPGDPLLVCTAGFFGNRLEEVALRHGALVTKLEKPWGDVFNLPEIEAALQKSGAKVVAIVQAETSTGALQPMEGLAEVVHRHGALLVMDCVTSLGGVAVKLDEWGVDAAYSGTQKCLGCPPGLAPVSLSQGARDKIRARTQPLSAWYFDLEMLAKYWGGDRAYHHTVSGTLVYALREGLRLVAEEGLEARWARHRRNASHETQRRTGYFFSSAVFLASVCFCSASAFFAALFSAIAAFFFSSSAFFAAFFSAIAAFFFSSSAFFAAFFSSIAAFFSAFFSSFVGSVVVWLCAQATSTTCTIPKDTATTATIATTIQPVNFLIPASSTTKNGHCRASSANRRPKSVPNSTL